MAAAPYDVWATHGVTTLPVFRCLLTLLIAAVATLAYAATPSRDDIERMIQQQMGTRVTTDVAREDDVQVVIQSGHAQGIDKVAASRDGRLILTSSQDGTAKLWDTASGRELRTFSGFEGYLSAQVLAFTDDSRYAVIGDGVQTFLFDVDTGRRERSIGRLAGLTTLGIGASVLSANGRFLASARGDPNAEIEIVELATGRPVWTTPKGGLQLPVAISDDGAVLITQRSKVSAGAFGIGAPRVKRNVQVWDVAAKKLRGDLPALADGDDAGTRFVLSPDGRYLVLVVGGVGPHSSTKLFTLDSPTPIATFGATGLMANWMQAPVFSPDGTKLLLSVDDGGEGAIAVIEIPSGRELARIPGRSATFAADGTKLVLGFAKLGAPAIYDPATGASTPLAGGVVAVWDVVTLGGGNRALALMFDGSVRMWDLTTGALVRSIGCEQGAAISVAAVPASSIAILGCSDGSVWRWQLARNEAPRQLLSPISPAPGAALQPEEGTNVRVLITSDGRRVIAARETTVSVVDAQDGREIVSFALPPGEPMAYEDPFAGMDEDTLKMLPKSQIEGMERAREAMQEETMRAMNQRAADLVQTMALHPNDRWLAIGRMTDLAIWDLETGAQVRSLGGAGAAAPGVAGNAPSLQDMLGASGQQLSKKQMKQLEKMMGGAFGNGATVVQGVDPTELMESYVGGVFEGAHRLLFRSDGVLVALGVGTPNLWDPSTGARLASPFGGNTAMSALMRGGIPDPRDITENLSDGAISPDGRLLALVRGAEIRLVDPTNGGELAVLRGHRSDIRALAFTADGRNIVSGANDGSIRVWSVQQSIELAQLIALGRSDYVAVTPDQYYRSSGSRAKGIAFRVKGELYPFEQFDLRFNRPDIVLERLGRASEEAIRSYRQAYQRRLKKLGFTEEMLGTEFHLPVVSFVGDALPVSTDAPSLPLVVRASDDRFALDRLQVFVNDVPIYGARGLAIGGEAMNVERTVTVPLVPGRNKIQASVLNRQGVESLKATAYTNATGTFPPPETYLVTIGVSEYANAAYNLRFAAKDAGDLAALYTGISTRVSGRGPTHVLSLANARATREEIRAARDWLSQAKVGDLAIVFAAGHGLTDARNDYYFGTYDVDPDEPAKRGLPYEDFEALLDGIAPLRKMLLIDTCFSGEIDKDDAVLVAASDPAGGQVKMRAFKAQRGVSVDANDTFASGAGSNVVKFQQDWFADLRRGTGAVVISSASGNEYAYEGEQWNNGVFTYSLLHGLDAGAADADRDQRITVGELQGYVIERVRALTAGGQNPTVRRENLDYDFEVY